ncbi:MAG TPA: hypothetical protein VES42_21240, partial [Pilimelia sp.]|nr:hypothetical protein [Pilimelia sp.]
MSSREWDDDPRNARGRHSAPDGSRGSADSPRQPRAEQPRADVGRARAPYPRYTDRTDTYSTDAGSPATEQGRRTRAERRRAEEETYRQSQGWGTSDRLEDTGAWTRGAHTGEWDQPDEGWPAAPDPGPYPGASSWSAPPGGPAGYPDPGYAGRRGDPAPGPPASAVPAYGTSEYEPRRDPYEARGYDPRGAEPWTPGPAGGDPRGPRRPPLPPVDPALPAYPPPSFPPGSYSPEPPRPPQPALGSGYAPGYGAGGPSARGQHPDRPTALTGEILMPGEAGPGRPEDTRPPYRDEPQYPGRRPYRDPEPPPYRDRPPYDEAPQYRERPAAYGAEPPTRGPAPSGPAP